MGPVRDFHRERTYFGSKMGVPPDGIGRLYNSLSLTIKKRAVTRAQPFFSTAELHVSSMHPHSKHRASSRSLRSLCTLEALPLLGPADPSPLRWLDEHPSPRVDPRLLPPPPPTAQRLASVVANRTGTRKDAPPSAHHAVPVPLPLRILQGVRVLLHLHRKPRGSNGRHEGR